MFRKDACYQPAARGSDGGEHKAFVAAMRLAPGEPSFFQVVHDESEVAAAGENTARKVSKIERSYVIKGFQHGKLTLAEPGFFQADAGIGHGCVGGAEQLHVGA